MSTNKKSLKTQNLTWLWSFIAADALLLVFIVSPDLLSQTKIEKFDWLRELGAGFAPVVALLFTSLLPANAKAILVFWRFVEPLPGHRAFSVHAPRDARINLDALRNNIGTFPEGGNEQNTKWYMLFKKVESDIPVMLAHQNYLLFRDLATLSLLIAIFFALTYLLGIARTASCFAFVLMLTQYLVTIIAARNNANRLVTNVLALHSLKRYV